MDPSELLGTLMEAVSSRTAGEDAVAVAYSGGVDSSLIAYLASTSTSVTCYCCATEGSADARSISKYADDDRCTLEVLLISEADLPILVSNAGHALASSDPVRIAYSIPTIAVIKRCDERVALAGNGADELFAGYEKYSRRSMDARQMMADDLEKSMDEARLIAQYANRIGKSLDFPFLDKKVIEVARTIPLEEKIAGQTRKAILRETARRLGLKAAERPKKAAQYSSGILRMMQVLAKRAKNDLSEWTLTVIAEHPIDKD